MLHFMVMQFKNYDALKETYILNLYITSQREPYMK